MPSRGSEFENLVLTHTRCLRTALIIHTYQGRPWSTNYINRRNLFLAVAVCRGIKISSSTRFIIKCQVIQFVLKMIDFYWNRSTSCIIFKLIKLCTLSFACRTCARRLMKLNMCTIKLTDCESDSVWLAYVICNQIQWTNL